MTKSELLGVYRTSLNNCSLAYASLVLWAYPDTPAFFEELYAKMNIPKPHAGLLPMLRDNTVLKIASEQLYNTVHRAALKELFELTKGYCEATHQLPALKSQPWFQFWRVVRNCFSHDMRFRFNAYDLSVLPVSWSGVTLDASFEGKQFTQGQFSRDELREFMEATCKFVETGLA